MASVMANLQCGCGQKVNVFEVVIAYKQGLLFGPKCYMTDTPQRASNRAMCELVAGHGSLSDEQLESLEVLCRPFCGV